MTFSDMVVEACRLRTKSHLQHQRLISRLAAVGFWVVWASRESLARVATLRGVMKMELAIVMRVVSVS